MKTVLQRFEEDLQLRALADNTCRTYLSCLTVFLRQYESSGRPVEALEREDVRTFLLGLVREGSAPSTVRVYGSALGRWAKFTLERPELVELLSLPRKRTKPPRPAPLPAERVALLRAAHGMPEHYTLVATLLGTGARASELLRLRVQDIDATAMLIHLHGKGDKPRSVPMLPSLYRVLRRYWAVRRPPGPWLFPTRRQGRAGRVSGPSAHLDHPMSKDTLRNRLRDLVALGGLRKVTPHDLRRTYATELLEAGVHPLVVQALLGVPAHAHRGVTKHARCGAGTKATGPAAA